MDGTLADTNYSKVFSHKQLVAMYRDAPVLYKPQSPFIAITARGTDADVKNATRAWLKDNQPNCKGVYFVSGGEDAIVAKKTAIMKRLNVTDWTDNNASILGKIKKLDLGIKLWKFNTSKKERVAY